MKEERWGDCLNDSDAESIDKSANAESVQVLNEGNSDTHSSDHICKDQRLSLSNFTHDRECDEGANRQTDLRNTSDYC